LLRGTNLRAVTAVIFKGHRTPSDDVKVSTATTSLRSVTVRVPTRAHEGRLTLLDRYGGRSTTRRTFALVEAYSKALAPEPGRAVFFYDAERQPTFMFQARTSGMASVEVVDATTGVPLREWAVQLTAGASQSVMWDGLVGGKPAPPGKYRFRLADAARALLAAAPQAEEPFLLADHVFPIAGKHDLGQTPTNGFGGGRNHKGQDMFAGCGTALIAARGGRVEFAGYHSAAGNYVVVDGTGTGVDYVYMHMLRPPLVKTGQRVRTGEKLGQAGETGRATGCHLHFEMWSSPGWYSGGAPYDPLPALREWDAYS
jgi:murein DD-endopeptidase MepM/ murein hydrolase activator NlpD